MCRRWGQEHALLGLMLLNPQQVFKGPGVVLRREPPREKQRLYFADLLPHLATTIQDIRQMLRNVSFRQARDVGDRIGGGRGLSRNNLFNRGASLALARDIRSHGLQCFVVCLISNNDVDRSRDDESPV